MRFTIFLATLAVAASTAHAAMNHLVNHCNQSVWYTQTGGDQHVSNAVKLQPETTIDEAQFFHVSGTAIKFSLTPDIANPVLQFAYTYAANQSIYYNLDTIGGFSFWGKTITLTGDEIPSIVWSGKPGTTRTSAYIHGEKDLTFTLCA